jgi:hypothetical protein
MSIELIPLFSVPVIKFKFSKHNKYNFPTIERRERIPDGWEVSLNSSYPCIEDGDPYIFPETRDCIERDLFSDVQAVLKRLGISYKGAYFTDTWYNVYHDDQGQEPHDHLLNAGEPNSYWSGIYYNRGASPTKFHNAHRYMKLCMPPDIHPDSPISDMYADMHDQEVEDGDVILFPPWLVHEVVPDKTRTEMRLTFTFNVGYNHE